MVDLDSNKLTPARVDAELPALPEPEGTILKNHLKQVQSPVIAPLHSRMISHFLNGTILKMMNEQGKVLFELVSRMIRTIGFQNQHLHHFNSTLDVLLFLVWLQNWIENICWWCYHCCSQWKLSTHNKPNLILIPFSLFYHPSFRHPLLTHNSMKKLFSVCKKTFFFLFDNSFGICKAMTLMDSAGAGVNI